MAEPSSFLADVRRDMTDVGQSLVRSGAASSFEVAADDGGFVPTVTRTQDAHFVRVTVTGTTEAFLLNVNGTYVDAATAYDDESKWDAMRDLFACLVAYLEFDYFEEVGERNGHVVHRMLHLTVPGGTRTVPAKSRLRGSFGRLLGYRGTIVRPAAR
jgi:hypothetical protein